MNLPSDMQFVTHLVMCFYLPQNELGRYSAKRSGETAHLGLTLPWPGISLSRLCTELLSLSPWRSWPSASLDVTQSEAFLEDPSSVSSLQYFSNAPMPFSRMSWQAFYQLYKLYTSSHWESELPAPRCNSLFSSLDW